MLGSGFSNAPIFKLLLFGLVTTSILASITDTKHYFYIEIVPHLYPYRQLWRLFTWQTAYTSSTELLFAAMTLYHMRLIERLWGSRKLASYLSIIYILTSILPPVLLATILRPLSLKTINYLPSGPTAILFSFLAQYHATIPQVYKYRVATSSSDTIRTNPSGLIFSDKSLTYLLAAQLALSQLPGSLLAASVGWVVGLAWRYEILLPSRIVEWRVPAWVVKGDSSNMSARAGVEEQLRRRSDEVEEQGSSSALGSGERVEDARRRA